MYKAKRTSKRSAIPDNYLSELFGGLSSNEYKWIDCAAKGVG